MKTTNGETVSCSIDGPEKLADLHYEKSNFYSVHLCDRISTVDEIAHLSNLHFVNCTFNKNCGIGNAVLENITFSNLKTSGILICTGVLLNQVVIKGNCGSVSISSSTVERGTAAGYLLDQEEIAAFNKNTVKFYESVTWALDISNAQFKEFELDDSIPAELIKINSENQIKVNPTPENLSQILSNDLICNSFKSMIRRAKHPIILVASTLNKKIASKELESIRVLREEGVADEN